MAITRLKRKAKRNKVTSRVRKETIQRLNSKPVIKNVDLEEAAKTTTVAAEPQKEVKKEAPKKKETKKGDDLKKIEGIGPKIAEKFNEAGIVTFADLAGAEVEKLKEILAEAGSRYKSHDPTTWPKQAGLAAEGKWDELKTLQDELDGGK